MLKCILATMMLCASLCAGSGTILSEPTEPQKTILMETVNFEALQAVSGLDYKDLRKLSDDELLAHYQNTAPIKCASLRSDGRRYDASWDEDLAEIYNGTLFDLRTAIRGRYSALKKFADLQPKISVLTALTNRLVARDSDEGRALVATGQILIDGFHSCYISASSFEPSDQASKYVG